MNRLPHSYSCGSCHYWDEEPLFGKSPDHSTDLGLCRRHPPTVHLSDDLDAWTEWPKTRRFERCGDGKHFSDVYYRDMYEDDE